MMLRPNPSSPDFPSICMTRQGKHKIFVGMAAGVGKTYRMLEEAQCLKRLGKDVVIGLLETHDRPETIAKAEGLEIIPRQVVNCRGLIFHEMDAEAILERQPQLVLVDDLAHPNFPGSCRESRYQDVEVLLAAGIDVYSTVNIQHLASLRSVVTSIPGIVVKNPIPDRLLDTAKEVVVVDVTPETLQERLRHQKIFPSAKIEQMLNTTFQRQNLATLRELALRQVANNVEEVRMREGDRLYKNKAGGTELPCCVHERILVCVSTEPHSIQLIKRGGHLASIMNAPLYGLFVHNADRSLTRSEALYINTCEQLCQDFRGEFLHINHFNVPEAIAQVAKAQHITQVILGKTRRSLWHRLFQQSIVDQLINLLPEQTDLHIIFTES
jgi:two-component system sensor histidine kinase KdpD